MRPLTWLRPLWSRANLGPNLLVVWLLAFGLGASALLYSAADRLIFRPVRVSDPSRLVRAGVRRTQLVTRQSFEYKHFAMARRIRAFRDAAADSEIEVSVARPEGHPVPALAHMVSGRYFALLEGVPEAGRTLDRDDDDPNEPSTAVVLGDAFCRRLFGGSGSAVGSPVRIRGRLFTVVGVMPRGFLGISLDSAADLWIPLSGERILSGRSLSDPQSDRSFSIFARLRDGSTASQAAAELGGLYGSDAIANREENPGTLILEPINIGAFSEHDRFSRALMLLLWGFAIMLAMVVVNVAAVLLVRSARRARVVAIEVSLGASPARIILDRLREALLLVLAGAVGALVLAYVFAPVLVGFLPLGRIPATVDLRPGLSTVLLVAASAIVLSLLFGAAPAWRASRADPQQVLRSGSASKRSGWWIRALLAAQAAGAALILLETALMIRTWEGLRNVDVGFDDRNLIAFTVDMATGDVPAGSAATLPSDLVRRAPDLPGVTSACVAAVRLMHRIGPKTSVALPGTMIERREFLNASFNQVSDGFFSTLKIPILSGRALAGADAKASSPTPVVVNAAFGRLLFGNADPVGRRFGSGPPGRMAAPRFAIVGVAGDSRYRSLREPMAPIFYRPFEDGSNAASAFTVYVRAESPPADVVRRMRAALFGLNPTLAYIEISTVRQQAIDSVWLERLTAALGLILSAVSGLMAATGLYGLLSYDVSQRQREFAIRVAVGGTAGNLAAMLASESARILGVGLLAALAAHGILVPAMAPYMVGVHPFDAAAVSAAVLCFAATGAIAAWAPIRRAMTVSSSAVLNEQG